MGGFSFNAELLKDEAYLQAFEAQQLMGHSFLEIQNEAEDKLGLDYPPKIENAISKSLNYLKKKESVCLPQIHL